MKRYFIIATIIVAGFGFCINNASAFILLSGDVNIEPTTTTTDNEAFFSNTIGTGSTVKVLDGAFGGSIFNDIYDSFTGVASTLLVSGTTITVSTLAGVDLFVAALPSNPFTTAETVVMSNFLAGGGDIFFVGDHAPGFNIFNERINSALTELGSLMSLDLVGPIQDGNPHTTTNILSDPLTSGVGSFTYSAFTEVFGGSALIKSESIISGGKTIIAYESTATEPIPEPATIALLGIGLAGLLGVGARRKWKKKAVD